MDPDPYLYPMASEASKGGRQKKFTQIKMFKDRTLVETEACSLGVGRGKLPPPPIIKGGGGRENGLGKKGVILE